MPRNAQAPRDSTIAFQLGWTKIQENYFAEYYQKMSVVYGNPIFQLVIILYPKNKTQVFNEISIMENWLIIHMINSRTLLVLFSW